MERRERVAARKADLLGIEAEGILFDLAEELDTVSDLEPAKYAKHLDKMRKRYSRSPIGVKIPVESIPDHGRMGSTPEATPEQVNLAAQLMLSGKAKTQAEALIMAKGA